MKNTYPIISKCCLVSSFILIITLCFFQNLRAQNLPVVQWDKTIGGSSNDDFRDLDITSDGGYIIGGNSYSGLSGDKSQPSKGGSDYWIVKLDSAGKKLWDKSYGGIGKEILWSLQETSDGGFILAGTSDSGQNGDKSDPAKGVFWIVKVDAAGNKIWDKTLIGGYDYPSIIQTTDGGYFVGGIASAGITRDKSQPSKGGSDYWVIRLDAAGNKLWDKTYGGSKLEELHKVKQTADGGFILGGSSDSEISGDKTQASRGFKDFWIVKLDAFGNKVWDVTLGGNMPDILYTIEQTSDGGYIAGGQGLSTKSGDRSDLSRGSSDYWVVRLDPSGQKLWDKAFGGTKLDDMFTVQQTKDDGFVLGGRSVSEISEDKSQPCFGSEDFWIIKIDVAGLKQWDLTVGGTGTDTPLSSALTLDGGLVLGGIRLEAQNPSGKEMINYYVVKLKGGMGEKPIDPMLKKSYSLSQNRPNPFNKSTKIFFDLPESEQVELVIYNGQGEIIARHQKQYAQGNHELKWEALMEGKSVNPGIYYYKISTSSFQETKRMILLK